MAGPKLRQLHLYAFRILLATSVFLPWQGVLSALCPEDLEVYNLLRVVLCCENFLHHASR